MRYFTLIILILVATVQFAVADTDTDSIRKQNQYKGRDIKVNHRRTGYTQAPNHFRHLLPLNGGQLGNYSGRAKPSVKEFPAIRYIKRRQR
jgi:hypothetical protein